jgi:hypothetical protein
VNGDTQCGGSRMGDQEGDSAMDSSEGPATDSSDCFPLAPSECTHSLHTHLHTHARARTHTHTRARAHAHAHAHTHAHTHAPITICCSRRARVCTDCCTRGQRFRRRRRGGETRVASKQGWRKKGVRAPRRTCRLECSAKVASEITPAPRRAEEVLVWVTCGALCLLLFCFCFFVSCCCCCCSELCTPPPAPAAISTAEATKIYSKALSRCSGAPLHFYMCPRSEWA